MAVAVVLLASGAALVMDRGGILAWAGTVLGAILLAKSTWKPGRMDLWIGLVAAGLWLAVWAGTAHWVISTWESGEVIELAIETPEGPHTARIWVLDVDGAEVAVYDAEPDVAEALRSGRPIRVKRGEVLRTMSVEARPVDSVDPIEVERLFGAMGEKYGERNTATDVFYSVLGRPRNRIILLLRLVP
ncbi:hypothetical protein K2X89_12045 [Myxococcota bacterium]|nr:hypothetical protein [Myxococcota bacterium]